MDRVPHVPNSASPGVVRRNDSQHLQMFPTDAAGSAGPASSNKQEGLNYPGRNEVRRNDSVCLPFQNDDLQISLPQHPKSTGSRLHPKVTQLIGEGLEDSSIRLGDREVAEIQHRREDKTKQLATSLDHAAAFKQTYTDWETRLANILGQVQAGSQALADSAPRQV